MRRYSGVTLVTHSSSRGSSDVWEANAAQAARQPASLAEIRDLRHAVRTGGNRTGGQRSGPEAAAPVDHQAPVRAVACRHPQDKTLSGPLPGPRIPLRAPHTGSLFTGPTAVRASPR